MATCPTCSTPLDDGGRCGVCEAKAQGYALVRQADYATVRELMALLEEAGIDAEMERRPPASEQEVHRPIWNLYVSQAQLPQARQFLGQDWTSLLGDEAALEAARRGAEGVDLDAGGEISCPACGHVFTAQGSATECPDCGLGLGVPDAGESPGEAE